MEDFDTFYTNIFSDILEESALPTTLMPDMTTALDATTMLDTTEVFDELTTATTSTATTNSTDCHGAVRPSAAAAGAVIGWLLAVVQILPTIL